MKPFLENNNILELELIQEYMDSHGIKDPELLSEKDYEAIQESVESDLNRIDSKVTISFIHMLKYRYQPSEQKKGWLSSIARSANDINKISKSQIKNRYTEEHIQDLYNDALNSKTLSEETGMDTEEFPKTAKEAFGECRKLEKLGDWEYMKNHFISKYAIHDKKEELIEDWESYKKNFDK